MNMQACLLCKMSTVDIVVDFGPQPMSNRFLQRQTTEEFKHPLILGYCKHCYLTQLINPAPIDEIRSRYSWMSYREPEGHLDDLTDILCELPGITKESIFCGISAQEDSLLNRLDKKGFKTWRLDLKDDFNIHQANAGIETIQHSLNSALSKKILKKRKPPAVLIVRQTLEHAHDPLQFIMALKELVDQKGYVVFEVPDSRSQFEKNIYSALWEEHTLYFTPLSFLQCLNRASFKIYSFLIYPYTIANSLVAIVQCAQTPDNMRLLEHYSSCIEPERRHLNDFSECYPKWQALFFERIFNYRKEGGVALFGAGHLACHLINLMELKQVLNFVVDDNTYKRGLFMPGSQLPILPTSALIEKQIKTCLLSVNSESEQKIIDNKQNFIQQKGRFFSIFPTSNYALRFDERNFDTPSQVC